MEPPGDRKKDEELFSRQIGAKELRKLKNLREKKGASGLDWACLGWSDGR